MSFLKRNWLSLIFIAALIGAPFAAHRDSTHQAKKQADFVRQTSIARCIATAPRAAYDIAFQYQAGEARRAAGNIVTAARYRALADAGILTVAAPMGYEGNKALVEVEYAPLPGRPHRLVARLTQRARELQRLGCEQAYERLK